MKSSPDAGEAKRLNELIKAPSQVLDSRPDEQSKREIQNLKRAKQAVEIEDARQDLEERKKYARFTFWLVSGWLIFIAATILLQGFRAWGFSLDYKIIIAVIGGTTTSTVGLFLVVARYLFHRKASR